MRKRIFGYMRTTKVRISLSSAQFDQGLHSPLTESLDTIECMNREQRPGCYFVHVQDVMTPHILRTFEGTFHLTRPILHFSNTRVCNNSKEPDTLIH